MNGEAYEDLFRRISLRFDRITCSVRRDTGAVIVEWYDFGNVYGCYRSAEGATLAQALAAALAEIEAPPRAPGADA
ncbi:MAG TPA: hypothetical protein VNJ51_14700 [Candidatus Dormibacteraeota bacterium]|nr:hypothetical protein [Candidatus Dormibacteraeota bacterium]